MPVWPNSTHWFRRKTRSYADADRIRNKSTMSPLLFVLFVCCCFFLFVFLLLLLLLFFLVLYFLSFFFFLFFLWGGGGGGGGGGKVHNLALIDPEVSEKMFEECGRRHRRACLHDKLTNQYIKRSALIIRSKICRIKMIYTFEAAVKEDNQIERDFTGLFLCSRPVTQKRFWNAILLRNVSEKTYRTNLHIYRFNFSDAIFHRSRLCRGLNSEKVKLALSLEPSWIVWWNFPCPLILTRSRTRDCKISLSIHWSRLCRCPNCKNLKIAHNSCIRNIWIKILYTHWYWQDPTEGISEWHVSSVEALPKSKFWKCETGPISRTVWRFFLLNRILNDIDKILLKGLPNVCTSFY